MMSGEERLPRLVYTLCSLLQRLKPCHLGGYKKQTYTLAPLSRPPNLMEFARTLPLINSEF